MAAIITQQVVDLLVIDLQHGDRAFELIIIAWSPQIVILSREESSFSTTRPARFTEKLTALLHRSENGGESPAVHPLCLRAASSRPFHRVSLP